MLFLVDILISLIAFNVSNPMANIYLRVSSYVAAFCRSVGDGNSLPKHTPIKFSEYTQEYAVLYNGLRIVPEAQQHRASCYSQSAWSNMSRGRLPNGGKPIINREPSDFLTYAEVCTLESQANKTKTDAYDFICIECPREVVQNNHVLRVGKSYTLDSEAARDLRRLLKATFVKTYLEFENNNNLFAKSQGFHRSGIEILERFFMEHDIPVYHDLRERETMRRLIQRWRKEAESLANSPAIINNDLITRIDEHERRGGLPRYDDES